MFRPNDIMNREECAVIITRLDELMKENGAAHSAAASTNRLDAADDQYFIDVPKSRWSYKYIETAKYFMPGSYSKKDGVWRYHPEDPMCRGDLVAALMLLTGVEIKSVDISILASFTDGTTIKNEWKPYVAAAIKYAVLLGDDENMLCLDDAVTRREACALIVRATKNRIFYPIPRIPALYAPDIDSGFYDLYFDEAVFVGDSITMGLRNYILSERGRGRNPLGGARFLCAGSYGLKHAASPHEQSDVSLSYQGKDMPLESCLSEMKAKEVYIMLGMNDWAGATLPDSIEKYAAVLDKIYAENPDVSVYIQFCTPITLEREAEKLNNANNDKFNKAIAELCAGRGIDHIDVSTPMKDENNALKAEYASDQYVHMNPAGSEAWIKTLREFAMSNFTGGFWKPPPNAAPANTYPGSYVYQD
jgi:lysophospholipase L1-like esterase